MNRIIERLAAWLAPRPVGADRDTAAADRLAEAEARTEVADPAPTMPDLWAAERAVIDLPDDCTVDDYVTAAGSWPPPDQPAGADERPVQTVSAPADPSPAVGAADAGGFPIDDAAIARVIAPVLRCCGIRASQTTAEIVAREVTHFFDVTPKRD